MLRDSMADLAALVDPEGDLAEVHVLQRTVQGQRVAGDGGHRAPLGLARIEVGRGEHDCRRPARQPVALSTSIRLAARLLRGPGELGPGVLAVAVQLQRAAHQHDAAVAHGVDVLARHGVGQRDRGVVLERAGLGADLHLAAGDVDPVGDEVDDRARRRKSACPARSRFAAPGADVEHHLGPARYGHFLAGRGHLARRPCRGIRPLHGPRHRGRGGRVQRHVGVIPVTLRGGAGTHGQQQGGSRTRRVKRNRRKYLRMTRFPSPGTTRPSYMLGLRRIMKRVIFFAKRASGKRRNES